ncbi:MAG: hypothetical protein ABI721_04305 [Candidatus Dojkabacteria bacterium]
MEAKTETQTASQPEKQIEYKPALLTEWQGKLEGKNVTANINGNIVKGSVKQIMISQTFPKILMALIRSLDGKSYIAYDLDKVTVDEVI